jgi:hypothetical protein
MGWYYATQQVPPKCGGGNPLTNIPPPIHADAESVTFRGQELPGEGPGRTTIMTLASHEFILRFLIPVPPKDLHRIRHYCLLAGDRGREG